MEIMPTDASSKSGSNPDKRLNSDSATKTTCMLIRKFSENSGHSDSDSSPPCLDSVHKSTELNATENLVPSGTYPAWLSLSRQHSTMRSSIHQSTLLPDLSNGISTYYDMNTDRPNLSPNPPLFQSSVSIDPIRTRLSTTSFLPNYALDTNLSHFEHSSLNESPTSTEGSIHRSQDDVGLNNLNDSTERIEGSDSSKEKPRNTLSPEPPSIRHPYHSIANYFSDHESQLNLIDKRDCGLIIENSSTGFWSDNPSFPYTLSVRDKVGTQLPWFTQSHSPFPLTSADRETGKPQSNVPFKEDVAVDLEFQLRTNSVKETMERREYTQVLPTNDICTESLISRGVGSYIHEGYGQERLPGQLFGPTSQMYDAQNGSLPGSYLINAPPYIKQGSVPLDPNHSLHLPGSWHPGHGPMSFRSHTNGYVVHERGRIGIQRPHGVDSAFLASGND